jgi:hypothetical protein
MILTDTGFTKEIYEQSGAAMLSGSINLRHADSTFSFGITGASGATSLYFAGSKYYDSLDRMLGSYTVGEESRVALHFNQTHYSVYVNEVPIIFGQPKPSTGTTTAFFVDSVNETEFSYQVVGGIPNYTLTSYKAFITGSTSVTGELSNNSPYDIVVYSGQKIDNANFDLVFETGRIDVGQTGTFEVIPQSDDLVGLFFVPYILYTNFGNILTGITLSGYETPIPNYSIEIFGNSEVEAGTSDSYYVKLNSRSGDIFATAFLLPITGTGQYTSSTTFLGNSSGTASGFITEFGLLNYVATITGTGNGNVKSVLSTGTVEQYATGTFSRTFTVPATGYATGINYSGLATGFINYNASGQILDGSGKYFVSAMATGTGFSAYNLDAAFYTHASGSITYNIPEDDFTSDILYIHTLYHGIVFGFHYNSFGSLITYLNNNTGLHRVTAYSGGPNTIRLSGLAGSQGNYTLLHIDQDNDGDMSVSGPYLMGGTESGYNISVTPTTAFTGSVNDFITGSGNYSKLFNGTMSGIDTYISTTRALTDIWNLSTGVKTNGLFSFKANGSFHVDTGYYNGYALKNNFFAVVNYFSSHPSATDVVRLLVSGLGNATGVFDYIDITGVS